MNTLDIQLVRKNNTEIKGDFPNHFIPDFLAPPSQLEESSDYDLVITDYLMALLLRCPLHFPSRQTTLLCRHHHHHQNRHCQNCRHVTLYIYQPAESVQMGSVAKIKQNK